MTQQSFTPGSVITRNPGVLSRVVEDETVLLEPETGSYFALNQTGTAIWELIEKPTELSQVRDQLLERFEVDSEEAWDGIVSLIAQLVELHLAEAVSPEAAGAL